MALPINIDELLRGKTGNDHFLETMHIHQAFVDEKAYLASIGKELESCVVQKSELLATIDPFLK